MAATATTTKKLEEAFKKSKDIDFDLRFMGAQELCELLDDDKVTLDEDQKVKIVEVFINQLDDSNKEVRSHAVRCISKILYRINELTLKKAIDKVLESFAKEDIDIYAVCLKTIVTNIDLSLGSNLCATAVPHLYKYITSKDTSEAASEQSLDILFAILKKFPQFIKQDQAICALVEKEELADRILELLQKGSNSVKRTASNCLGSLSGFLSREKLVSVDDKIFKGINSKDLKNTIIRVQTLALLKRNSGARLSSQIPDQTGFYIKQLLDHLEEDKIDTVDEEHLSLYIQSMLQILENGLRNSDRELIQALKLQGSVGALQEIIAKSIHFNPNMPGFLEFGDEDEQDDDNDEYGDNSVGQEQDTSWKVRKVAVKVLKGLLHLKEDSSIGIEITKANFELVLPLIKYVDSYVNEDLFEYTLDLIPVLKDIFGDGALKQAECLYKSMLDFIKSGSEANILGLLLRNVQLLASLYPAVLDKYAKELLSHVSGRLKKKELTQEAKSTLFSILQILVTVITKNTCKTIGADLFSVFERAKTGKESLSGILMIQSLFQALSRHEISDFDAKISSVADFLVTSCSAKLELKVKKAILEAFAPLIAMRKTIGSDRLFSILEIILGSFGLEALHLSCISSLESFGQLKTLEFTPQLNKVLNSIVEKLLELFTTKNKIYQIGIVRVLEALHKDQGFAVEGPTQLLILKSFTSVIEKCDLGTSKTIAIFLLNHQQVYKKYQSEIEKSIQLMRSQLSTTFPDDDYLRVLVRLHQEFTPAEDYVKSVNKIFETIRNDPHSEVGPSSLFLFFLFQTLPDVQQILTEIVDDVVSRRSKNFCLSLGLLGYLGYLRDLSKSPMLVEVLVKNISSSEATVKSYAVKALTGIGIFDITPFKPVFDTNLAKSVETRMFFFASVHALFEYLPDSVSKASVNNFLDYLSKFVELVEEAERPELFKAFGRVLKKDPSRINKLFQEFKAQAKPDSVYKLLGASVCKQIFDASQLCLANYPIVSELLLECINSSDPDIETAAFVSLDAIFCVDPKSVETLLNMQVCNLMAKKMVSDESLVEKIEMGMFSHKIDNGLKLRKACFNFLFRLCQNPMFNIHPFLAAVVKGLGDENEDVRYQATRVVKEGIVAHGHTFLLSEFGQELGASLEKAYKTFKAKLAVIVQEKGGNYQSLKSLVALIQELAKSNEFGSNPQIKALENEILSTASLKDLAAK